jgi:hypothetical protein
LLLRSRHRAHAGKSFLSNENELDVQKAVQLLETSIPGLVYGRDTSN